MSYPSLPINDIVSSYKDAFDWLHQATSRNIIVNTDPLRSGCPNHSGNALDQSALNIYDPLNPFPTGVVTVIPELNISGILNQPFASGMVCPVCGGQGDLFSPTSGTVAARIQWRTADNTYEFHGEKLTVKDSSDVRIKVTGAADLDLLDRSNAINIDGRMCKIAKGHVPVGLRDVHSWYYYCNLLK